MGYEKKHFPPGPYRIGVYTGGGASHSWLWSADLADRLEWDHLSFLNEDDVKNQALDNLDVFFVSGGDTFAVAEALGPEGARAIDGFVSSGGLYLGACAGAYLVLNSSKHPLNYFNFVSARVGNLTAALPRPLTRSPKFCTGYGCAYIFHPVREALDITIHPSPGFWPEHRITAPLYGGPPLIPGKQVEVLATYTGFTSKTQFLVDPDLAARTVIGQAAAIRSPWGQGEFYLFGPHCEHPHYIEANRFLADCIHRAAPRRSGANLDPPLVCLQGQEAKIGILNIKREISNARIVAAGLENRPVTWILGQKVYEPLKIRVFLESIWTRLGIMEKTGWVAAGVKELAGLAQEAESVVQWVRGIKNGLDRGEDTTPIAEILFPSLKRLTAGFLAVHFRTAQAARTGRASRDGRRAAPVRTTIPLDQSTAGV